jgi:hypothetical protein
LICCVENALSLGIKHGKDEGGNLALIGNGNPGELLTSGLFFTHPWEWGFKRWWLMPYLMVMGTYHSIDFMRNQYMK